MMKVVLLAGGYGTRISEETALKPKPMIEIGGKPILWHIMKHYARYGVKEFVVCLGYKGYVIKEYFANYFLHMSDLTIDLGKNSIETHQSTAEDWKVTLVETGLNTMTGGRLKRVLPYLSEHEPFMMTYGDGVSDVDIHALQACHEAHGKLATVTSVMPSGRFGALELQAGNQVASFREKPQGDGSWINGGFFVLQPDIRRYLTDDTCVFEKGPLEQLAQGGELVAYKHEGFWKPMDTLRDRTELNQMWDAGSAPWYHA
jgi:glucose-1-phosphate cytidylyltransferase